MAGHRLKARIGQINDGKSSMPQRNGPSRTFELTPARSIWPSMRNDINARPVRSEPERAVKSTHYFVTVPTAVAYASIKRMLSISQFNSRAAATELDLY